MQHAALNTGADSDGFVRVHILTWLATEKFLDLFLDHRHAGLTADQNNVGDVRDGDACVLHRDLAWLDGACNQIFNDAFQFGAGDLHGQMFRPCGICGDVGQVYFGLLRRRQFDLGFFCRVFQALQCQHVFFQIDAGFLLEFFNQEFDHAHVEIFSAQERVAVGGHDFKLVFAVDFGDVDDGDVERAATQVINSDLAIAFLLVHAEGQCSSSRFVDDALDIKACDAAGILGGLALRVIEVGRHGNDSFSD